MVVTVIGAVLLLVVLVFSLLRFITAMAAVVIWILENVVGWRTRAPEEQEPEAASTSTSSTNNSESKKSETQQKAKKTEEPVSSTKLTTPIENVIKKTVKEDPKSKNLQPSTSKQKAKPLNKPNQNTVKEDNKPKPAETTRSDKSAKKTVPSKPKEDTIQPNKVKAQLPVDVIPVKEQSKGNKKNKNSSSPISDQSSKNSKENTVKPSIVDQNKKKDIKRSPETAPVTSKKPVTVLEAQKLPVTRPVEAKIQLEDKNKTEARETKKVCSSVSYANVVTNNIPETKGNSEADPKLEAGDQKEQTSTSAVIISTTVSTFIDSHLKSDDKSVQQEVLEAVNKEASEDIQSQAIHEPEPSKIEETDESVKNLDILDSEKPLLENNPEKERENNSENLPPIKNLENLSKSESSSIEVICEEQNIDFPIGSFENIAEELKESNESQTQFEVIKENLNKLIQFTSESEQILCRSDSSSICIIDNQPESIESEIGKIEETQPAHASFTFNTEVEPFSVSESEYFSTDDQFSNSDTFIVVEKESEQNVDISEGVDKVPLQEISTSASTSQDLVEKAIEDSLTEYLGKEQVDAKEDYCVLEKFESVQSDEKPVINEQTYSQEENNYTSEANEILDIIEELQLLEKSDQLTHETNLEENSREFIEETPQEESVVQNSEIEPQTHLKEVEVEAIYSPEDSNVDKNTEKTKESIVENSESLLNHHQEVDIKEDTTPNSDFNEEFLQLEEVRNLIDSEEIQNNLNNSQLTEELSLISKPNINEEFPELEKLEEEQNIIDPEELQNYLNKSQFTEDVPELLKPNPNISEEFLQLEKSGEERNIIDSEELQNNLNNSQLAEEVSELSLKPNLNINEEFPQLEKSEEVLNIIDSEDVQNNLNNSQFSEDVTELSLKPNLHINEEIPQLEKSSEVRNIIDSEEIQNNLINSQLTEEVSESSLKPNPNINEEFPQLNKSEEERNIIDSEEIQNNTQLTEEISELSLKPNLNINEEFPQLEKSEEERNIIDSEEIQNNTQLTEEISELSLKPNRNINEEFLQLEKSEEVRNIIDSEEIQDNLNNSQLTEEVSELSLKIEPTIDKTDVDHQKSPQEIVVVEEEKLEVSEDKLAEMAPSQIRVLTLNDQEHQECTLYRIEKNWAIQFRLGPSLFGRKVYLYCNYPVDNKGALAEFNRDKYQLLNWVLDEGCKNADDTAVYTQIVAKLSGSFHYYFTFEKGGNAERQGSGFFLVDPILKYGNNEDLPLDCIQCQTVLAKNLGSFSTWEKKLQVAKESGYNMIHFTPVQELGVSRSCYSLSEQLKLNPVFQKENGAMPTFEEIKKFIGKIRKDWKVTSICDIVLNHTANESEWIKAHPEVTYNCVNCPYMRPAYLLDAAFHQFSMDVKKGLYEDKGIPIEVDHEDHLNAIRYHFRKSVLETLKIEELFICDTNKLAVEFSGLARSTPPVTVNFKAEQDELRIFQDEEYKRLAATVDMTLALKLYNVYRSDSFDEDSRLKKCTEDFKSKLDSLNNAIIVDVNDHLTAAIENVIAGIRYFRVQPDGPKVKEITIKNPLVHRYFTDYGTPKSITEHEEIMYSSNGRFLMAHNGWVMNSDPLKNFAAPDSNVYLRRELIAWGDSVKLRYGDGPKDCPFLWEHMKKYVEQTAEIFDGVRLDNCHSTPIPVAEYLLDCARRVRPDLYVVAELFTNSDMTDNIFVNRLGITSLIREAMSAWDSHEEGRLVYRYGGTPVGSFYQPRIRPLVPSIAHALFLDLTHDNPSPVEKRSVFDLLPSTALVNMACCASGSNRGYDELVPHHIHVVDETRQYTEWTDDENSAVGNLRYVTKKSGIILAKKAINDIHFTLGKEGYNQVYVDQMDPDIVAVTRHRPDTHESYILVAFTAFGHPSEDAGNYQRGVRPLRFEGVLDEIVLEATLSHVSVKNGGSKFARWENFTRDSKWINGLSEYQVALKQHVQADESDIFEKVDSGTPNVTQLNFKNFKPGSVVVIKASLPESMKDAVKSVRSLINQFSVTKETELSRIIDQLTLADLNRIIYRCDQEERDEGFGFDTYHIPNFGSLVYAGLQGFVSLLANIRPNNDLGHPMCANLRDGNWMIEYIWKRLKLDINTRHLGQWIEENTKFFNNIPRYLVPSYFDVVVTGIYVLLLEKCYKLMSNFVNHGSTFVRGLSLGSVQFAAYIKSADLPVLSPNLAPPKPPTRKNDKGESIQACVTLSAGLPHFAVGYMRNWGRDTFISLRGLFILTGRFEEARQHILGYAACLRHGLIPNLLDGGRNSRFNCRDAVWWWLYCIKEYVEEAPNGDKILADKVSRIFPTDDSPAQPPGAVDQPLHDVMQEALKVHFQGLTFRERNAGKQIDEHMTDRGFNNQIGVHPETGFVFGGNAWNCGTWMDKMGSSDKAGNRGRPATPRDGSAIELIGLSKAVVTWLWKLNQNKKYPYSGVERTHKNGSVTKWTFKEWSDKIQANFEKYFWINNTPVPGEYRSDLIHKRGIYKDSFGASNVWADFQLRCNFPIAMVAAPELFTPQQAWTALKQAEKHLLGPLGMKTLDPKDWLYNGNYDNSNDSTDPSVANGFNYHQGPEWVWPVGFFLRAKLHFASLNGVLNETIADTKVVLSKHFTELQSSVWRGLAELTNSNGSYCHDSSRTQAWSMACILEVLHDLQKIESNQPVFIN